MNSPNLFEPSEIWKGHRMLISIILGVSLLPFALFVFAIGINRINEHEKNKKEIRGRIIEFVEIESSYQLDYYTEGNTHSVLLPSLKTGVRLTGVDSLIKVSFTCFFDSTFRDTIKNKEMYAVINKDYKAELVKFDNKVFYSRYNISNEYISSSWMLFACFLFFLYSILGVIFRFHDFTTYIKRNLLWSIFLGSLIFLGFIYSIFRFLKMINTA